jgi:predicted ferric reductase
VMDTKQHEQVEFEGSPASLFWIVAGAGAGAIAALLLLPTLLPSSPTGLAAETRAWWYLSRASGFVSWMLVSLSMVLGLLLSTKSARRFPGGATAATLHEHASLLGLGFALFHGLILLGDRFVGYTLGELVVPFGASFRADEVGLGPLAFWGMAIIAASFYARRWIGRRLWRGLHLGSFAVFVLTLFHGLSAGSDKGLWALAIYAVPGAVVVFLSWFRVLGALLGDRPVSGERAA